MPNILLFGAFIPADWEQFLTKEKGIGLCIVIFSLWSFDFGFFSLQVSQYGLDPPLRMLGSSIQLQLSVSH